MNRLASLRAALLAFVALVTISSSAWGQTINLNGRTGEQRQDLPFVLNREECVAGNGYDYRIGGLMNPTQQVEVWVSQGSTACTDLERGDGRCVFVTNASPVNSAIANFIVLPADLVQVYPDGCSDASVGLEGPEALTLHFFQNLVDPTQAPFSTQTVEVDLVGPPAPTMSTTIANSATSLTVRWTDNPTTGDLNGFAVFCDPPVAVVTDTTTSTSTGTDAGAGGAQADMFWPQAGGGQGGIGGQGGAVGVGGTMTTTVTTTTTTAATTTATSTSGATSGAGGGSGQTCASDLPTGTIPDLDPCAEVPGASAVDTVVSNLDETVEYAFAVASVDRVGNFGPLTSEAICSTPEPTVDFFEAYRNAGGLAGGGLCSCRTVGGPPLSSLGPFGFFAALALAIARRRDREGA